ncbi:MAG: respiratory nitrate reductase subunit gamma [Nitrososphaerota archaeon]|nr:respiratory nitrate reductase subunit gamma [Nitrososphaerota archaeon]
MEGHAYALKGARALLGATAVAVPVLLAVLFASDSIVNALVFLVFPYVAALLFVVGLVYDGAGWLAPRRLTGLKTVAIVPNTFSRAGTAKDILKRVFGFYTLPKMEGDRTLIAGSVMFHYGMWAWIVSHLVLVLGMYTLPSSLYDPVGDFVARPAGILALLGVLVLTGRRVATPKMRSISSVGDYLPLGLLILILSAGLTQVMTGGVGNMDTVAAWLLSLLSFTPAPALMTGVSPLTMLYVVPSLIFVASVPFSKMVHIVSYLFNPTVAKSSYRVGEVGFPLASGKAGRGPAPGGGHNES